MRSIIKFLVRSLWNKKGRLLLVLFSIGVSSALLFANESFRMTVETMFEEANSRWGAEADYIIEPLDEFGASQWIPIDRLGDVDTEYVVPITRLKGLYNPSLDSMQFMNVIGCDIESFDTHNYVTLLEGTKEGFNDTTNQAIIGKAFSINEGVLLGDVISLEFEGQPHEFEVTGISAPDGLFRREEADGGFVIIPIEFFEELYGVEPNVVFVKLEDETMAQSVFPVVEELYEDYHVEYARDFQLLKAETENYVMPFRISALSVMLMSSFIIYTAFQLINLDRIPDFGTLRSIGCSRKRLNIILLGESVVLGLIGGLMGCGIGIGISKLMSTIYFSGEVGMQNPPLMIDFSKVFFATGIAMCITFFSALIPILKTTKIPIKNIILNDLETVTNRKLKNSLWILGLILLGLTFVVPNFLPMNLTGMIFSTMLITCGLLGLIMAIPALTGYVGKALEKIPFIPYEVSLGFKNVKDTTQLTNNIRLFAITIAIVAFMSSVFFTMSSDLKKSFEEGSKYDILVELLDDDSTVVEGIESIEGVAGAAVIYEKYSLDYEEKETFINVLYGIDSANSLDYLHADYSQAEQAIAELSNGPNIILTDILKSKHNLAIGDEVTISYENEYHTYIITGFIESTMSIGHLGIIDSNRLKDDFVKVNKSMYVQTAYEPSLVKNDIKYLYMRQLENIRTKEEIKSANRDKVEGIFNAISIYANIAMCVGIVGIVNNIIVGYILRKRKLASYRCFGMSKKQVSIMLMAETIIIGVLGVMFGIGTVLVMSPNIPLVVSLFWGNVTIAHATEQYQLIAIFGILTMMIISMIPAIKSNQLTIMESMNVE